MAIFVNILKKQAQAHKRCIIEFKRRNHRHIYHAVLHTGMGSDKRIVAILCRITQCYHKCLLIDAFAIKVYHIVVALIGGIHRKGFLQISDKPTLAGLRKIVSHLRIKPHSTCAHKGTFVDRAIVESLHPIVINHLKGFPRVHRNIEVTSQAITRATRHHSKRHFRIHHCSGCTIHRAITAHSHQPIIAFFHGFSTKAVGITFGLHHAHIHRKSRFINHLIYQMRQIFLISGAGFRIHYH